MTAKNAMPTKLHSIIVILAIAIAVSFGACEQANQPNGNRPQRGVQNTELAEPIFEASPTSKGSEEWQVISSDTATFTVTAPGARLVKILYRPAFAEGRHVELKKLTSPSDSVGEKFSTKLKVPSDFAGDVWAEASYAKGEKKETKPMALTAETVPASELAD